MALLYTRYKIFHFPEKLNSLPLENPEIRAPIHIRIKPTNVCNHDCWYCAYRVSGLQLGKDMVEKDYIPKEKMLEIIDDCIEMGVRAITFSGGGEPFVYKYLLDAIKRLSQTDISFAALTNGSKLSGEIAEIFAHHGTWIRVSIDGWDDKSYAEYRKTSKNEFSKVMKNMENFKKFGGKCYLGVSLVVDNKNYKHIYEFTKKVKDIGVDSIKISPCIVSNDGKENDAYHKPFFKEAKEQAMRAKEELEGDGFEVYDSYHEAEVNFKKEYSWCPYLQIVPVIGADLNVYSCHDKAYNLDEGLLGSIKNVRFKDWWFLDKSKFFKIDPSKVCNHHCAINIANKMIFEYLNVDKNHLGFL